VPLSETRFEQAENWALGRHRIHGRFGVNCSPMNIWLTIRTFIAFYLLAFGLAFVANAPEGRAMVGAFCVAAGLTFFWRLWLATVTGK
jgi:hypothetical protein